MLPDDVLLDIFVFFAGEDTYSKEVIETWQSLAHVCRRWRSLVFGSPRRLDLRLACSSRTPAKDTLDVWPAFPILFRDNYCRTGSVDNILAVLERSNRISELDLREIRFQDISKAMEVPFLELTRLVLRHSRDEVEPVPVSDSFLGGSAPRLQSLELDRIPFPGLPRLLLSATDLTDLHLYGIPHSGYISPEAMVACFAALACLERLSLSFQFPQSNPDWESQPPPPPTRTVLPALTRIWFKGDSEYLEDLVAYIDAPRLNVFKITFFYDIVFDTPQFTQFISRTPVLEAFDKASVILGVRHASVILSSKTSGDGELNVSISCGVLDWQVSFLEQVCASSSPPFSMLKDLHIYEHSFLYARWKGGIDDTIWLELLQPFTTVKNLYLSEAIMSHIASAIQELVEGRTTEVLPVLQNIFLQNVPPPAPIQKCIGKFVAARQVISRPILVSRWERE